MAAIKRRDTKPEIAVRRWLHAAGFRFRLDARDLPGRPDIVLPKYRTVVFVHGCFWHRHECSAFKWPKARAAFWKRKLEGNVERDRSRYRELKSLGWRVVVVWECDVRRERFGALWPLIRCRPAKEHYSR